MRTKKTCNNRRSSSPPSVLCRRPSLSRAGVRVRVRAMARPR